MKVIDLRSDTVTLPTEEMRRAMYEAEVGDDVFGEDPTVNRLEEISARVLGMEAGLFTVSGTMSNLLAIMTHTHHGDEVIVGKESHTFWYEVGGAAALAGVMLHTVPNDEDGRLPLDTVQAAIRGEDIHFPKTTLLCLENTQNRCGGAVLTVDYTASVSDLAHRNGIKVHLDGARIFNAAVALGVPAAELARQLDSVSFCVSKGLCAPVGSVLCGSHVFIDRARKYRKMVGGGMRQAGVIASAGIVAVEKMVDRLAEDHANARRLAKGLARIPGIGVNPDKVPSNIVIFDVPDGMSSSDFLARTADVGVKFTGRGGQRVRAVTHRLISTADIDEALERIARVVRVVKMAN